MTPRVTLAIPTYNRANRLRATVDACLAQTFADFELVIVDNASTDGTAALLAEVGASDPRVRLAFNPENVGMIGNFERCLSLARGEYFTIVCSDDVPHPGLVAAQVAALDSHPSAVASAVRRDRRTTQRMYRHFDRLVRLPAGVHRGPDVVRRVFRVANVIGGPVQVMARRAAVARHGFRDQPEIGFFFDIDPILRLLAEGEALVVLADVLCTYNSDLDSATAGALLNPEVQRSFFSYRDVLWADPAVRACLRPGDLAASRRSAALLLGAAAVSASRHAPRSAVDGFFEWLRGRAPSGTGAILRTMHRVGRARAYAQGE